MLDYRWTLTTQQVVEFVESGRNIFVAGSYSVSEIIRDIALETHIEFDPEGTSVFDHFNNLGDPTILYSSKWVENSGVLGKDFSKKNTAPVIFPKGKGMALSDESDLLIPILRAESTAYSAKDTSSFAADSLENAGQDVVLVAAIQTLANARATFVGAIEMLSDEYFSKTIPGFGLSGNSVFSQLIAAWTVQARGQLRAVQVRHFKGHSTYNSSVTMNPSSYRISDDIQYHVRLEEYDGISKTWVGYSANDVQLEAIMLDPYIRLNMGHDFKGNYVVKFRLPDVFGIYKLQLRYVRLGYTNLHVVDTISVHPYRHDEYERFIPAAYPYYTSAFSMMFGFFVFAVLFLYTK